MRTFKKILTEPEFKQKCIEKNIQFTTYLWNRYMDREWVLTMKELEIIT